eukprot:7379294-Prymnesium_polylepis.1
MAMVVVVISAHVSTVCPLKASGNLAVHMAVVRAEVMEAAAADELMHLAAKVELQAGTGAGAGVSRSSGARSLQPLTQNCRLGSVCTSSCQDMGRGYRDRMAGAGPNRLDSDGVVGMWCTALQTLNVLRLRMFPERMVAAV